MIVETMLKKMITDMVKYMNDTLRYAAVHGVLVDLRLDDSKEDDNQEVSVSFNKPEELTNQN